MLQKILPSGPGVVQLWPISTMAVLIPAWVSRSAATAPPYPLPMMRTGTWSPEEIACCAVAALAVAREDKASAPRVEPVPIRNPRRLIVPDLLVPRGLDT